MIVCCMSTLCALTPLSHIERVRNGGIDDVDPAGPRSWRTTGSMSGVTLTVASNMQNGNCLAIHSTYENERPWFWWEQSLGKAETGSALIVSGAVHRESCTRAQLIGVAFTVAGNKTEMISVPLPSGNGWQRFSKAIRVPSGATSMAIRCAMNGSGTMYVDDISVRESVSTEPISQDFKQARIFPLSRHNDVRIDGESGDWHGIVRSSVPGAYGLSEAEAEVIEKIRSEGSQDLSFDVSLSYDTENLYLLAEVRDDIRVSHKTYWQGDGIQFALDTGNDRTEGGYGPGVAAIAIAVRDGKADVIIERSPSGSNLNDTVRAAARDDKSGYTIEAALPWSALGIPAPERNKALGFSIIVNDNDGTGRKWAEWTDGIARTKSAARFGTLLALADASDAILVSVPRMVEASRPFKASCTILSLVDLGERTYSIQIGNENMDTRTIRPIAGATSLTFLYEPLSLPEGTYPVRIAAGDASGVASFVLQRTAARVRSVMQEHASNARILSGLITAAREKRLDTALPDASLAVYECFAPIIDADIERDGGEELALREAMMLKTPIAEAITKARSILASPAEHPSVPEIDIMKAVRRKGGWYIGDRPVFLIGYNQSDEYAYRYYRRLGANFCDINGGSAAWMFNKDDTLNEKAAAPVLERIAAAYKHGIRTSILFNHQMPDWFRRSYPDFDAVTGHFFFYDIDHPKARSLTVQMMEHTARAVMDAPGFTRVFDLWNEAEYSAVSKRGLSSFQDAMRNTYGSIASLNSAWGTAFGDFSSIPAMNRPEKAQAYYDFCVWNHARVSAFSREMRDGVLRGDAQALTCMKFINENSFLGSKNLMLRKQSATKLHNGIDRYAQAIIHDIHGADTRPTPLSEEYAFAWDYTGMCYDLMRSLDPDKPIYDSEWHGIQTVYYINNNVDASYLNAALWFSYLHGMDMNAAWWWSRSGLDPKLEFFEGSLLTQPHLLNAFAHNSILVNRFAREITAFQEQRPRVRLLYSLPSAIHDTAHLDALREWYTAFTLINVPVGFVTEEMLTNAADMGMLVLARARHAGDGVHEKIASLAEKGVTILSIGECLTLTPGGVKRPPVSIPGVSMNTLDITALKSLVSKTKNGVPLSCIGSDGSLTNHVEFRSVLYNGKRIGYIIGIGKAPAKVRIVQEGKPVPWKSLLTKKRIPGDFVIRPYDFDLIEFE